KRIVELLVRTSNALCGYPRNSAIGLHRRSSMMTPTDRMAATNPLAQLRMARRKPIAALLGATAGLVPVGVFELGHYEIASWSPLDCPKATIVYAGLLFSALTVLGWSTDMFGSKVKAIGFTALLEGIMMTADAGWLSAIALGYLVVINAVANGCRLAIRDTTSSVDWPANLARAIAAAAAGTATTKKPARTRSARPRRTRQRTMTPRLAAVAQDTAPIDSAGTMHCVQGQYGAPDAYAHGCG